MIRDFLLADNFTGNWDIDMQRYYNTPYDSASYIDNQKGRELTQASYIYHKIRPYPNPYQYQGSYQIYPFPDPQGADPYPFQACDGSLQNGLFNATTQTATTSLHSYKQVIILDGTVKIPELNAQGKYVDAQGKIFDQIGSVYIPSEDASDMNTYYFFGITDDSKPSSADTTQQIPLLTYNGTDE